MSDFIPWPSFRAVRRVLCPTRIHVANYSRGELLVARGVKCPIEVSKAYFARTFSLRSSHPVASMDEREEKRAENMRQLLYQWYSYVNNIASVINHAPII